jgi:cytosine/adenosine deaminase-related metal-dependent hydrolase
MENDYSLSALTMVTPREVHEDASIRVTGDRIAGFSRSAERDYTFGRQYLLFPALINAHDHLFGSYHPKIGEGHYLCWLPWDYDLKESDIYKERNKNSPLEIYLIGSYRNLISGVTTVHDHIPHEVNDPYIDRLPIRVIKDYSLSHECSPYDLKWGEGIDVEFKKAAAGDIPYVTHIEEGWDTESLRGIDILLEHNALDQHTVLIHGVGFSADDIRAVARRGAHFVWCPGSNVFMYGRTARIREILEAGINTSIGTDSPASGELNLLEEVRFARKTYREMYGEELAERQAVDMITVNPARAFRLQNRLGALQQGGLADLLIVSGNRRKPYASLVGAGLKDIALVIMEGRPLYGDDTFEELFRDLGTDYSKITVEGKRKCVVGEPQALMESVREKVGFHKELPFLPI